MREQKFFSKRIFQIIIALIFGIFGLVLGISEWEVGYSTIENVLITIFSIIILFAIGYAIAALIKLIYKTKIGKVLAGMLISLAVLGISFVILFFLALGITGGWIVLARGTIIEITMGILLVIIYLFLNTLALRRIKNKEIKLGIKIGYAYLIYYIISFFR